MFSGDDDLDLHVQYRELGRRALAFGSPTYQVNYRNARTPHAMLDVDANARSLMREPCENIVFSQVPSSGQYAVWLHLYRIRGPIEPVPYVIVVKYGKRTKVFEGTITQFHGMKPIFNFRYRF